MNLYVFEDVLQDYTSGMVVLAAADLAGAQAVAFAQYNHRRDYTLADFLVEEPGFQKPTGVYPMAESVPAGLLHEVYGGA